MEPGNQWFVTGAADRVIKVPLLKYSPSDISYVHCSHDCVNKFQISYVSYPLRHINFLFYMDRFLNFSHNIYVIV